MRRLAGADSAAYEPALAWLLNDLAVALSAAGRADQARAAIAETVEILRRLARADPGAHEDDLASSLNSLGIRLSDLGRTKEALAATSEALRILQRLTSADPDAYEPPLARALDNLAVDLTAAGSGEKARATAEEADEIRRQWTARSHRPAGLWLTPQRKNQALIPKRIRRVKRRCSTNLTSWRGTSLSERTKKPKPAATTTLALSTCCSDSSRWRALLAALCAP